MSPRPHQLPAEDFTALSHAGGGAGAVRTLLAARRSRTLLLIRFVVGAADGDFATRQAYRVLRQVQDVAPEAVNRVLDHPSVGAWATRVAVRLNKGEPAEPAELARVAIAAAVRGRVSTTVPVPSRPLWAVTALPSLGTALWAPCDEVTVRCGPEGTDLGGEVRIPLRWQKDGPRWRAAPELTVDTAGVRAAFLLGGWAPGELTPDLRVCDNPDRALWRDRIAQGWELLVRGHREVADELAASVSVLTPLYAPTNGGVHSATLVDAFGCLFLSLPPDAESVAVTLAHELQHNKLNAVMDLFELLAPVAGERFYAPWREDPRPLAGLLHGTYAYAGVSAFWRRQRGHKTSAEAQLHAHIEFAHWRASTLEATRALLGSGRLTVIGRKFVVGMAEVLERWCAEPAPQEALAVASKRRAEHRARWQARHG